MILYSFPDMHYAYQCDVGDIWSENGVALFAVIVHYIDQDWIMHARLGICNGLKDLAHTGEVIRRLTYDGLINIGIGNAENYNDVPLYIHMCTPDEGSNMLSAWNEIEGAGCVCHRQQTCLGKALSCEAIQPLLKILKGICAHFHRSNKVIELN
jgi:hypothetical protein